MASGLNKFSVLNDEGDTGSEVSFQYDNVIQAAMKKLPPSVGNKANDELVGNMVKAVVAAFLPMFESLASRMPEILPPAEMTKKVMENERHLDELEQYSRRDNIVIRGVPEKDGESTSETVAELAQQVGVDCTPQDISTSHRVGKPQPNKARPIVARFVRRDVRTDILKNKKKLKSTPYKDVMMFEHLAPSRVRLLQAVKNDEATDKVWTIDGRVHCTLKGETGKHTITCPDDLFKRLGWSQDKLRRSGLFPE